MTAIREGDLLWTPGKARRDRSQLLRFTQWLQEHQLQDLKSLDQSTAITYLEWRGQSVGQKTLDQERQAIQLHLGMKLPVMVSELHHALKSRAYTSAQIKLIASAQSEKYRLSTDLWLMPPDCVRMNC